MSRTGGWEWHDRHRDEHGRFGKLTGEYTHQIHIRMTRAQADRLRAHCVAKRVELGAYCRAAVLAALETDTDKSNIPMGTGIDGHAGA